MIFNSYTFVAFFALVVLARYSFLSWKGKKVFLLLASYVFYAAWNPPFVILLWVSTIADWYIARALFRSQTPRLRKLMLWRASV